MDAADIRNDLDENDRDRRLSLGGNVQLFERNVDGEISVEPIPGPYTKEWRETWLKSSHGSNRDSSNWTRTGTRHHLNYSRRTSEIRRISEDKHLMTACPIYRLATGEPFRDARPGAENSLLGSDEWKRLKKSATLMPCT